MKLGKKSKEKKILEPFVFKDEDGKEMVFHIQPLRVNLRAKLESYLGNHRAELFTPQEIEFFAKTHMTGWEGVYDEDGNEVEFNHKNAILALSDIENEDLAVSIYLHSYNLATGLIDSITEDSEQAKK